MREETPFRPNISLLLNNRQSSQLSDWKDTQVSLWYFAFHCLNGVILFLGSCSSLSLWLVHSCSSPHFFLPSLFSFFMFLLEITPVPASLFLRSQRQSSQTLYDLQWLLPFISQKRSLFVRIWRLLLSVGLWGILFSSECLSLSE